MHIERIPNLDAAKGADLTLLLLESEQVENEQVESEQPPDSWQERFGDAVDRAAEDARTTKKAAMFYAADGARACVVVASEEDDEARRIAAAKGAAEALALKAETVAIAADKDETIGACVEGFVLGAYRYLRYKTEEDAQWPGPAKLMVVADEGADSAIRTARIHAETTNLARDLVNRSPDETTPQGLGMLAKEAGEAVGLRVEVWDKPRIEAEGMGGLLAVNRGSVQPPAFIVIEHKPKGAVNAQPVVLVGKAVTFDTGGLSLKPTKDSMDHMKMDMAGGAVVIGAMVALARLGLPLHVIALIPSTDNRPGQDAYVPGDVVRMHSGATVEVLNTDAEGRMVLADALSYARRFDPQLVVDVATLTGAQIVALGSRVAAVITKEGEGADERIALFQKAGQATGDLVAPLPLFDFYKEQLESDVADLKNVGGGGAGAITAAKFLEHFTRDAHDPEDTGYPWVHLDIAGPAYGDTDRGYHPKGATGFGVRLLASVLTDLAKA